jgi:hypothetical protein
MIETRHIPLGNEEDSLELELTFDGEVLDGKVVLPVIGQALVEGGVLLGSDVLRIARPDGLGLVQLLVGGLGLLDLLGLLLLLLILIFNFLNLRLLAFLGFLLLLIVLNLL